MIVWAFINDKDLPITSQHRPAGERENKLVIQDTEFVSQAWERLLHASGGALALKKCFWWLITWLWQSGRPRPAKIANSPGDIRLTKGRGTERRVIERKEMCESLKLSASGSTH